MIARLADKLVLKPTRHSIATDGKSRHEVRFANGHIEVWVEQFAGATAVNGEPDLLVLKFSGTGGRAECATPHPAEVWNDLRAEVWAVNPPGYGGSSGFATLRSMPAAVQTVFNAARSAAGNRPLVVTGNSLGTIYALYAASLGPVDGLLLRNPPPLPELIRERYGWWNLGLASGMIARQVPAELCSLTSAATIAAPAAFVMSGRDRVVPTRFQQRVIDAYAGQKRVCLLRDADHADPVSREDEAPYLSLLEWLRERIGRLGPRRQESALRQNG